MVKKDACILLELFDAFFDNADDDYFIKFLTRNEDFIEVLIDDLDSTIVNDNGKVVILSILRSIVHVLSFDEKGENKDSTDALRGDEEFMMGIARLIKYGKEEGNEELERNARELLQAIERSA